MIKKLSVYLSIFFILGTALFAQEALKSIEEEYYDFLSLQGITERPALGYRTLSDSVWYINETEHLWENHNLGKSNTLFDFNSDGDNFFIKGINKEVSYKIYGPEWFNSYNTTTPYGQNDGALWQGVGYNTSFTAGATVKAFGLELTFKPQITFSQNKDFEHLPGVYGSEYSYFWSGSIDLVQRYGNEPYWQFDFGDTEVRYNFYTFTLGFGTQSPWLGPAQLNPMLGSNNAGTYPKFDFGFKKTSIIIPGIDWYAGDFETRIWVGQLQESDYFDLNEDNNKNMISGFNLSYEPSFVPGLTLGATKICIANWTGKSWKYLNPFYNDNDWQSGNGEDQKASVYVDWMFPSVGFESYFEYGFDDYTSDMFTNPFHTAVYTVGINQIIPVSPVKDVYSKLNIECSFFEISQDFQLEWRYMGYYAHGSISQGYTNKGQIIGAGSGYFGNSQYISYTFYYPKGKTSLYVHRNCPDANFVYNRSIGTVATAGSSVWAQYYDSYTTYLSAGINSTYFITRSLIADLGIAYIRGERIKFEKGNNVNSFRVETTLKYNF